MGKLIQTIPVYKPQTQQIKPQAEKLPQPAQTQKTAQADTFANSTFANAPVYSYAPARPLSPGTTAPIGVRPQAAAGRLVKENIFQSMGSTVKSYGDYFKYFYNAGFKGEGSDYSVGKINDLAIRAGSLGIATVLSTSKMFPFAKGMEFVGLGTWFAAMALWPRVLGMPIKMKTGVDINQRYVDSLGRRKYVFEDNQYRPMDIYRHADLNGKPLTPEQYYAKYDHDYVYLEKKGDQLGIPRDIKNRNEATMNKMGQVATQGRALSMLTAGVMTPVISSLVADSLQEPLKNHLEKQRYNKQLSALRDIDAKADELLAIKTRVNTANVMNKFDIKVPEDVQNKLTALIPENGQMSKQQLEKLDNFLTSRFFGTGFYDPLMNEIKNGANMTEPHVTLNAELRKNLSDMSRDAVKEALSKLDESTRNRLPKEILEYNGLEPARIQELLEATGNVGMTELNTEGHNALKRDVIQFVKDDFRNIDKTDRKVKIAYMSFRDKMERILRAKANAYMESQRHFLVNKETLLKMFRFAEANNQLQSKIKKFEEASIKNISESMTANNWAKVPPKYLKALGFNKGEIAVIATQEADVASKTIAKRLETLVQNPEQYKKAVEVMTDYAKTAINKEEKAVIELIGTANRQGTLSKIRELMLSVAQNEGYTDNMIDTLRRHYNGQCSEVQRKFRNTIDSFVRPLKAMDVFKDIKQIAVRMIAPNQEAFYAMINEDKNSGRNLFYPYHNMSYTKACESTEKFIKDVVLQKNDINNWTTKYEHPIPASKTGLSDTREMIIRLSSELFSEFTPEMKGIINDSEFLEKSRINNNVMKARYLRLINVLKENQKGEDYMSVFNYFDGMITQFINDPGNKALFKELTALAEDRISDLPIDDVEKCKEILRQIKAGKNIDGGDVVFLYNNLKDFGSSNKAICEMSGKNITDFFIQAAQETRARNKWSKLVHGLLIGTGVVSAVTIALMGKKNYFNKDIYEPLDSSQGAGQQ